MFSKGIRLLYFSLMASVVYALYPWLPCLILISYSKSDKVPSLERFKPEPQLVGFVFFVSLEPLEKNAFPTNYLEFNAKKHVFRVSDKIRLNPACLATKSS